MNGQTTTPPQQRGVTFWQIIGSLIFIFILLILLPSWVVVIVAGIPLAMGLAGLLNRWFGVSESTTRRIVLIAAVAFLGSVGWNYGERQYPWIFENLKVHGMWRSFQATQAIDPQQPLGLHKSVYDTQRDRVTHKQQKWAEVLQGLRGGANPTSVTLETALRNAGLLDDISFAAKDKIVAGTLTAEDVIAEAEAKRITLQQQLERIRLTPLSNAAPRPWIKSIQQGPLWAKLFWPGLLLAGIGVIFWLLPPARKWGSRLVFLGCFLAILGGAAAVADIKSADQIPGLRSVTRAAAMVKLPTLPQDVVVQLARGTLSQKIFPHPRSNDIKIRGPQGTFVEFSDGTKYPVTKLPTRSKKWTSGFRLGNESNEGPALVTFS